MPALVLAMRFACGGLLLLLCRARADEAGAGLSAGLQHALCFAECELEDQGHAGGMDVVGSHPAMARMCAPDGGGVQLTEGSYVELDHAGVELGGATTFALWAKRGPLVKASGVFFAFGRWSEPRAQLVDTIQWRLGSGGTLTWWVHNCEYGDDGCASDAMPRAATAAGAMPPSDLGSWAHLAGAVENRTARLFVDGALVATAPFVEPSRSRREVRSSSSARDRRG